MKINQEWYDLMPNYLQEQWDSNVINVRELLDQESESFFEFIADSFVWEDTPEGENYWNTIAEMNVDVISGS